MPLWPDDIVITRAQTHSSLSPEPPALPEENYSFRKTDCVPEVLIPLDLTHERAFIMCQHWESSPEQRISQGVHDHPQSIANLKCTWHGRVHGIREEVCGSLFFSWGQSRNKPDANWRVWLEGLGTWEVVSMKAGSCLCKGRYPSKDAVQRTQRSRNGFLPPSGSTGSPQVELFFFSLYIVRIPNQTLVEGGSINHVGDATLD